MNTGIGLGGAYIIVGVLVAYAFIWDALKYRRLAKKIDEINTKINKMPTSLPSGMICSSCASKTAKDEPVGEEVRAQEKELQNVG